MMGPEETRLENFICGTRDLGCIEPANYLTPKIKSKGWLEGPTSKKQKERDVLRSSCASRVWLGNPQRS